MCYKRGGRNIHQAAFLLSCSHFSVSPSVFGKIQNYKAVPVTKGRKLLPETKFKWRHCCCTQRGSQQNPHQRFRSSLIECGAKPSWIQSELRIPLQWRNRRNCFTNKAYYISVDLRSCSQDFFVCKVSMISQLFPDLKEILESSFGIKRAQEMKLSSSFLKLWWLVPCCYLVVTRMSILSEVQQ